MEGMMSRIKWKPTGLDEQEAEIDGIRVFWNPRQRKASDGEGIVEVFALSVRGKPKWSREKAVQTVVLAVKAMKGS